MAGYCGYSKSNNALIAESEGKFPLTFAAKRIAKELKLRERDVREAIRLHYCEWHHTSCRYNKTYYYDVADIIQKINNNIIIVKRLDDAIEQRYHADIEYIEWSGTRTRPKANIIKLVNVEIIDKGSYVIFVHDGITVKKFKKTNGFYIHKIYGGTKVS